MNTAFAGGILELRTGARPASAGDAPTGTVVATIVLPNPAFGNAANGAVALAGVWQDASADAAGVVTWARFRTAADTGVGGNVEERVDVSAGMPGSGADLILNNTNIAAGQQVTIDAFTFTEPAGVAG